MSISRPYSANFKPAKLLLLGGVSLSMLAMSQTALAQDAGDEVIVTGIRQSLENALVEKREADSLIEVIFAEDIGKLPDQNLAEVLENITGVQITREAGVGTGVQIRGTDQNRIEINGVGTVGAGNARVGISFEDIDPSIIAGLEVIKAPESSTIEGAVGGTVNLRTIRPLDLKGPLASARFQLEDSSLSQDGLTPRFSAALGNNWENASGQEIGFVVSGSYTESDNSAFRPRLDRDNTINCNVETPSATCAVADGIIGSDVSHFLGVQFLNQVQINQEFETINLAGSLEAKPTQNLRLYIDGVYNDQTRRQESSRAQISNVSQVNGADNTSDDVFFTASDFDTFELGEVPGPNGDVDLGSIVALTAGSFQPQQLGDIGRGNGGPFLRASSDTGSRLTETYLIRLGGEWEKGNLTSKAEFSHTESDTRNPNFSSTLNFINPNSDVFPRSSGDIDDNGTPDDLSDDFAVPGSSLREENGVPIIFDLRDGIAFGIDTSNAFAPSVAELLDPTNYVFDNSPTFSENIRENADTAVRLDFNYDLSDSGVSFVKSVDFGYRYNDRTNLRDNRSATAGSSNTLAGSLNAGDIAGFLAPIPDNFGSGTGSDLFISDLLIVDPELASDPTAVIAAFNAAVAANPLVTHDPIGSLFISDELAFFDISEETHALYGQINFETALNNIGIRGNVGVRYIDTTLESLSTQRTFDVTDADGDGIGDDGTPINVTSTGENSYTDLLPRVNIAADVTENIVLRGAYYEDISRPDFTDLTFARTLPERGGVNDISRIGNPELEPEEIRSFDVSADWYFAPEGVFSIGYFHKRRSNLIGDLIEQPGDAGDGLRETVDIFGRDGGDVNGGNDGAPCALGGVFSEDTDAGIFGDGRGVCVGDATLFNAEGSTTQQGIETAIQYNLGAFEDRLGWASGFGFIANYTYQTEDTNTGFLNIGETRAQDIFDLQGFDRVTNPVSREAASLLNLSNHSYNLTGYYEKYGLSARLRYTWRDAFLTDDLPGTSNEFDPLGFRGVVEPRGQLNGSLSYDINDHLTVNVDAVNLTESSQNISCINDGGLLCYEGITDRRVIFGASYTF